MTDDVFIGLAIVSVMVDGVLAGAGLDQVLKQLPSRKRIGVAAYADYFMAADLSNGRYWYGSIGILSYVLTIASMVIGYVQGVGSPASVLLLIASISAMIHAVGTSQAAPTAFSVPNAINDEIALTRKFDKFSSWTMVRGIAGALMFAAMTLVLVTVK
jgi:hypothetical protein